MKYNLKDSCGLDITLDPSKPELISGGRLHFLEPGVRTIKEMAEVILDKDIAGPNELYYMYRDVYRPQDKELLQKYRLRYDVTLIKPDPLGKELMKTAGHYHPGNFGELYEVVYGNCFCLLQKPEASQERSIEEVILVKAARGEKIVIPPGFGHILVNPGPQHLVTSNWVSSEFSSEYQLYKKAQGAAYFVVKASGSLDFVANPYFDKIAGIRFVRPSARIDKFGLEAGNPMYPVVNEHAEKLDFLNRPLDFSYEDIFDEVGEETVKAI